MIQAKGNGQTTSVEIEGTGLELMEEFAAIVRSLTGHYPQFMLRAAFEMGLEKKKDKTGSDAAEELLKAILGKEEK